MPVTGEIYHIMNRGVDERNIFQAKRDYTRFLLTLLECNDCSSPSLQKHRERRLDYQEIKNKYREPLVEIPCLCLMTNHFHIVVKQLVDNGIPKLMQRVGNSYTKYFNIKNERKGTLFMSGYKSIHVDSDIQLRHLITYIHSNPLDFEMYEWRKGRLSDIKKAKKILENYAWSSYPLYTSKNSNELIEKIIKKDLVKMYYPNKKDFFEAISSWSNRYFEILDAKNLE